MAYGYAYALLGDAHLAEDAAQEAFIVAWRRLEDIRNPDAFPGWLRSVVRTQCDRMTRGKRLSVVPLEEAANVCTAAPGADTRMETEEARTSVFQALRALPEGERIATTLYYVDGYTQKEIACFLRINPATVSTRLYSARKQLKGRLARMVPSDVQGNRPSRDGAFVRSVHEYLQQFADDSQRADRTLLDAARERLNQLEGRDDWLPEEARAALDVCVHTGRQDRGNDIVRRYLKQRLPVEEEAWARQNLTAGYAVCREFASAVEEHRRFLAWARASLPPDRWAWVFNNGTSANCWIQQNVGQDWISTYREILDVVPAVPGNREDRWHLLRTAGHVFGDLGDAEGVADAAERTRLVADECESEEAALKIRMEAATMVVNFHAKAGPQSKLLDAAREILTELDSCACDPETGDAPALRLFAGLYHNAGGPLYRAKEYGLAATFFRRSIRYGGGNAHTYGWLAACLHATDGDRRETLSLLREAAWRDYKGGNLWSRYKRKLPEFVYVADDPEFAAAGALSM